MEPHIYRRAAEGPYFMGDSPCTAYACSNIKKCTDEKLACKSFLHFAHRGRLREPSEPSRKIYKQLFETGDRAMQKLIAFESITKEQHALHQVQGIVYKPNVPDKHGDFMLAAEIERSSHRFISDGFVKNIDTNHDQVPNGSAVVESFTAAKQDSRFPTGAWVVKIQITDPHLWALIADGELKGLSFMGSGKRTETQLNGKTFNQITDLRVDSISLVKKGANQETVMLKADQDSKFAEALKVIGDAVAKNAEIMKENQKQIERMGETMNRVIDTTNEIGRPAHSNGGSTAHFQKQEADRIFKQENDSAIRVLRNRVAALDDKAHRLMEAGGHDLDARLNRIYLQIEKAEVDLCALGYVEGPSLMDNSAFVQRGGTSNYLHATHSERNSAFGIKNPDNTLQKAEDIDLSSLTLGGRNV